MHEADLFLYFLKPLSEARFDYMVTGSVASIIYGRPRMTIEENGLKKQWQQLSKP